MKKITMIVWYFTIAVLVLSLPLLINTLLKTDEMSRQTPFGNIYLHYFLNILWIFSVAPILVILYQLKKIAEAMADDKPFADENSKRLRIMASIFDQAVIIKKDNDLTI